MDEELSKTKMQKQVDNLESSPLPDQYGWELEADGFDLFVTLPCPKDGTAYELKVNFDNFPQQAPSYQFTENWPNCPNINEDKGICIDGTRECYTAFNHDERREDWDPDRFDLTTTLQKIYHLMRK